MCGVFRVTIHFIGFKQDSKLLLYLPSCRPKEVKLFEDKDGNLATYIEDCVSSGKFLQIYLPVITLL